jgi:HEAT repeat protein
VVESACWALGERRVPGALEQLVELAGSHPDARCREAAVAALGTIGDPIGLPGVLGALQDRPAVRRRAAVALAAFHGPQVDEALQRCLADHDWQVRQAAEILLDS